MKKYLYIGSIILLLLLGNYYQYKSIQDKNRTIAKVTNNYKALSYDVKTWKDSYNREHARVIEFSNTNRELKQSNDSLDLLILKVIKENKINKKNLDKAGVIITELTAKLKADSTNTTVITDTDSIKCFAISDTLISNIVCIDPIKDVLLSIDTKCLNTQFILFESERETIMPRRKFFMRRWFQKKHTVCYIEVINSNPYIATKNSKFIKLIK